MHKKESKFIPSCLPKEEDIFLGLLNNYPRVWELLQSGRYSYIGYATPKKKILFTFTLSGTWTI